MTQKSLEILGAGIAKLIREQIELKTYQTTSKMDATIEIVRELRQRVETLERRLGAARAKALGRTVSPVQVKIARPSIKAKIARRNA